MVCSEGHQPKSGFRNRYDFVRVHVCPDMSASPLRAQKDLYLHGLEMRLPKLFETWNNMKRLIDRIVIRQLSPRIWINPGFGRRFDPCHKSNSFLGCAQRSIERCSCQARF